MILAVLRSRLKPNIQDDYAPLSKRMSELAPTTAGYISHKGFVADDGERITIVEFESEEALETWRTHPEHVDAKRRSYREFYTDFSYQICSVMNARSWTARGLSKPDK
jgi:heme-degrading monooxygenase HmoA